MCVYVLAARDCTKYGQDSYGGKWGKHHRRQFLNHLPFAWKKGRATKLIIAISYIRHKIIWIRAMEQPQVTWLRNPTTDRPFALIPHLYSHNGKAAIFKAFISEYFHWPQMSFNRINTTNIY